MKYSSVHVQIIYAISVTMKPIVVKRSYEPPPSLEETALHTWNTEVCLMVSRSLNEIAPGKVPTLMNLVDIAYNYLYLIIRYERYTECFIK